MEDTLYLIFVVVVTALCVISYFIRLFVKRRKYAQCPRCGHKTKLKWVKKEVERSFWERLRRNFHEKKAYEFHLAVCCENCDHEIKI